MGLGSAVLGGRKFRSPFLVADNLLRTRVKPTRTRFVTAPPVCALALRPPTKKSLCSVIGQVVAGDACPCWKYTPETGAEEPREFVDGTKSALFARRIIMADLVDVRASIKFSIDLFFFETVLIA